VHDRARGATALVASLAPGHRLALAVLDGELAELAASPSLAALALPAPTTAAIDVALRAVRDGAAAYRALPHLEDGDGRSFRAGVYRLGSAPQSLLGLAVTETTPRRGAEQRLRTNRERLAAAERMARVGAWTWRPEPEGWTWSDGLFALSGLPLDAPEPTVQEWLRTLTPDSRSRILSAFEAALAGRRSAFDILLTQLRPDGSRRILRSWASATVVGAAVVRLDGVVQDVTKLERAAGRQAAVAALGREALAATEPGALLDTAAILVAETLGTGRVSLLQPDEAEPGSPEAVVAATGEAVAGEGLAVVPIRAPWGNGGVLSVRTPAPGGVDEEDLPFLGAIANVLAGAIERLRLEDELTEQAAARGRLVAQALDAEDRARREISEMLHDGPLQDLLALNQRLARLEPGAPGDERHLERARIAVGRAVAGLRDAMVELHPVLLEVGGLESALGAVAAQQGQLGGFVPVLHVDPEAAGLRDALVLPLARELLVNVTKHAAARQATVWVRRVRDEVLLEVVDDGRGLPDGRAREAVLEGHIGLASARQRVEAVGGRMELAAAEPTGTHVTVTLPV
jgi:signal transduction histidine kinase